MFAPGLLDGGRVAGTAAMILFLAALVLCLIVGVLLLMAAAVREGRREIEEAELRLGPDMGWDGDEPVPADKI